LASKPAVTVFCGLASKPAATVSSGLTSKHVVTISDGLASKPAATIFSSLTSKLVVTVSSGLTSKPAVSFLVEPQNQGGGGFFGLGLKNDNFGLVICASKSPLTVSWFVPQNQMSFGLSVAPQNQQREVDVEHASISSCLLRVEASLARVSQSGLKIGGGAMTGGACGTITEVASEAS
jgi:hypothetical protein